jgi:hypothetical protein
MNCEGCGRKCWWFFLLKGPVVEATDAPQPWRLIVQPCDEDDEVLFLLFHFNGALMEWNWHGKTEVLGEKPVPVPLCPPQIPHESTRDFFSVSFFPFDPFCTFKSFCPSCPIVLSLHNKHNTNIHAPGGIRTHNSSKRATVDPRLRPQATGIGNRTRASAVRGRRLTAWAMARCNVDVTTYSLNVFFKGLHNSNETPLSNNSLRSENRSREFTGCEWAVLILYKFHLRFVWCASLCFTFFFL